MTQVIVRSLTFTAAIQTTERASKARQLWRVLDTSRFRWVIGDSRSHPDHRVNVRLGATH